ncbi:MAG TPA: DUF1345 domain-containing protein [Sphingomonas sp.]|nr:DUF1345 domain-containing protein [Sphingomonas sp.]
MATRGSWRLGNRIAPPRFVAFALLFAIGLWIAIPILDVGRGTMAAFDVAGAIFLLSLVPLLRSADAVSMRAAAKANDANRAGLLALTGLVMAVILIAVARELTGHIGPAEIALVIATLALAWLFSNTVYALHYAHLYYLADEKGGDRGGLTVPDRPEPDYWDFVYFAFTLGMTFQTSDVAVTGPGMRRVTIGHCLAAFVFNLGILAFTINVLGSGN